MRMLSGEKEPAHPELLLRLQWALTRWIVLVSTDFSQQSSNFKNHVL